MEENENVIKKYQKDGGNSLYVIEMGISRVRGGEEAK